MADEPKIVARMLESSSVTAAAPMSGNKIIFEIKNDEGKDLLGLQATLTIPCGKKQGATSFLLSKNGDPIKLEATFSSAPSKAVNIGAFNRNKKGMLIW